MTLTVGSLFSGIGGLELGLEAAGMETRWQVEKSAYCQRILAKHWPDVVRYTDVKDVGAHNLAPVDVICGGFPCQDISYAGKGAGLTGHRSGLWVEFARIIGEMGPRYAIVENVPALLTRGIDQVLGTLADLGYDARWSRISAADVGAPHLRQRIFLVAYANAERRRQRREQERRQLEGPPGSIADRRNNELGDPARGRREQHHSRLGNDGVAGEGLLPLVDAEGGGRGAGREQPVRRTDGGREPLGHPDSSATRGQRREVRGAKASAQPEGRIEHRRGADRPADAGGEVGDSDRAGLEQQRLPERLPAELRPAERGGRKVRDWSDATPVRGADGTIRLVPKEAAEAGPQSPLWPVADGIPGRVARLSAIGNAVVPRVAEQVGHWINRLEEQCLSRN